MPQEVPTPRQPQLALTPDTSLGSTPLCQAQGHHGLSWDAVSRSKLLRSACAYAKDQEEAEADVPHNVPFPAERVQLWLEHNSADSYALCRLPTAQLCQLAQALSALSDDLCMAVMRHCHLPLHRLLPLLPPALHALPLQAHHPSIFSQHALMLAHATAPALLIAAPLLPTQFSHLTSISLRGQPLPNRDSVTLFRGLGALRHLSTLDMSDTVWSPAAASAVATHLPAAAALHTITLNSVRIYGAALAMLVAALRTLRTLRVLAVSTAASDGDFSDALGFLHAMPGLEDLSMGDGFAVAEEPACQRRAAAVKTEQLLRVSSLQHLADLRVATWDCSRHGDTTAPRSEALIHALAQLPLLSCLDLSMHVMTEPSEGAFLQCPGISQLSTLRTLRISAPCATIGNAFLAGLSCVAERGMAEISIRHAGMIVQGVHLLARALHAAGAGLEVLQLDTWPAGEAAHLATAGTSRHDFGGPDQSGAADRAALPRALAVLTALTALCCMHCTGMSRDLELGLAVAIVRAAAICTLRGLRLSCCAMASTPARPPAHLLPQYSQHGAGRSAVAELCDALAGMHALDVLDLSGNTALGDDFAVQFAVAAGRMPALRRVSLARCGVTG
eukprot:jgi/Ulvmu1/1170/UM107_0044.1